MKQSLKKPSLKVQSNLCPDARLRIEHGFAGGYTIVKDYILLAPSLAAC